MVIIDISNGYRKTQLNPITIGFFPDPPGIFPGIALAISRPARAMRRRGTGTSAGAGTWCTG